MLQDFWVKQDRDMHRLRRRHSSTLGIVRNLQISWLDGKKFPVEINHKPLMALLKSKCLDDSKNATFLLEANEIFLWYWWTYHLDVVKAIMYSTLHQDSNEYPVGRQGYKGTKGTKGLGTVTVSRIVNIYLSSYSHRNQWPIRTRNGIFQSTIITDCFMYQTVIIGYFAIVQLDTTVHWLAHFNSNYVLCKKSPHHNRPFCLMHPEVIQFKIFQWTTNALRISDLSKMLTGSKVKSSFITRYTTGLK